ncbi:MAG: hypothetical protein IJK44_01190 [Bacteroidales bacterium]|nr:hypothetical protein [Bacteroidales bacterium]
MKRIINALAYAVLTAAIISCQAQLIEEETDIPSEGQEPSQEMVLETYTAFTGAVTKTSMDGDGHTIWSAEDNVKVYYANDDSQNFEIQDGIGSTKGIFSGLVPSGKTGFYAVYPAANTSSVDIANRKVTVTIPNEQTLDATTGGFKTGNIATSKVGAGNNLNFTNVNAFLSVTVSAAVTKVVVESVDGTTLASGVEVTYPEDPADPITYSNSGTEYPSITLLLPGTAGTYYFSVVPGTHDKGLKFTYYTGSYTETGTYYLNKSLAIERNDNWQFGAFEPTKDYYVKASGSGGNGLSWSSALTPVQMWNMITLASAGDDSAKKSALFAAIDGATFHLGAGDYNFGAAASLAVSEASTLNITFKGGYPAAGGSRDLANYDTSFTGDDDADGTGDHRILTLDGDMSITFDGITFTKGLTSGSGDARFGGGVWIKAGSHSFVDCTFSENSAVLGGAIRFDSTGSLTLTRTTFSSNTSSSDGGALSLKAGTIRIEECSFSGNSGEIGGAIDSFKDTSSPVVTIIGGSFTDNTASVKGGAIASEAGATIYINKDVIGKETLFTDNYAAKYGGSLDIESSNSSINNWICHAVFKGNHAQWGGAVEIDGTTSKTTKVYFENCTFGGVGTGEPNYVTKVDKTNDADGGAIHAENDSFVNMTSSSFIQNNAHNKGGAICIKGDTMFRLFQTSFNGNYAKTGGVAYTNSAKIDATTYYPNLFIDECSFDANYITTNYGCVFNIASANSFIMHNSSVRGSYVTPSQTGEAGSWIDFDGIQSCTSISNCSIIGDAASSALVWACTGSWTNYFTNNIITSSASSTESIHSAGSTLDLNYNHYYSASSFTDSGGNVSDILSSSIDNLSWSNTGSPSYYWKWDGTFGGAEPSKTNKTAVNTRVNSASSAFMTWSGSDFVKDQRGVGRGNDNWWPGAYQN